MSCVPRLVGAVEITKTHMQDARQSSDTPLLTGFDCQIPGMNRHGPGGIRLAPRILVNLTDQTQRQDSPSEIVPGGNRKEGVGVVAETRKTTAVRRYQNMPLRDERLTGKR